MKGEGEAAERGVWVGARGWGVTRRGKGRMRRCGWRTPSKLGVRGRSCVGE